MAIVLITGGTGELGSKLEERFAAGENTARVLSRRARPAEATTGWGQGERATGAGLGDAVRGDDIVVEVGAGDAVPPADGRLPAPVFARSAGLAHPKVVQISADRDGRSGGPHGRGRGEGAGRKTAGPGRAGGADVRRDRESVAAGPGPTASD